MQDPALTDYERGREDGRREMLDLVEAVSTVAPSLLPPPGRALTMPELVAALTVLDPDRLRILRPFSAAEALNVKAAARIAGFAPRTLANWVEKYRIGRHVGDSLRISHPALLAVLDGDAMGLAALLDGRHDHPAAAHYRQRAGLKIAA